MANPDLYIVGICGGSGSGKTSFIKDLARVLPPGAVSIITQDNYYKPVEEQQRDGNGEVNFDLPGAIDRDSLFEDISTLLSGRSIFRSEYTFNNIGQEADLIEVHPTPVLIIEGLFVLYFEELRERMDLKIFLDVPEQTKLERRVKRDAEERGYSRETVMYQWENHVMPSFREYLEPYSKECDLIVSNRTSYDKGLLVLRDHIKSKLRILEEHTIQSL